MSPATVYQNVPKVICRIARLIHLSKESYPAPCKYLFLSNLALVFPVPKRFALFRNSIFKLKIEICGLSVCLKLFFLSGKAVKCFSSGDYCRPHHASVIFSTSLKKPRSLNLSIASKAVASPKTCKRR